MQNPLLSISWNECSNDFPREWLSDPSLSISSLTSGLEANVFLLRSDTWEEQAVLKIWDRGSRPDVGRQYKLLQLLIEQGTAVSKPLAWGINENNHQVLLTSYDGEPLHKVNKEQLTKLANLLIDLHHIPAASTETSPIPVYDFKTYFFPRIEEHPDLHDSLTRLMAETEIRSDSLIHGDFNLGNVLVRENQYTMIDWTNGQWGDARYDAAWSILLVRLYAGERNGSVYRNAFLRNTRYLANEIELFEAMACLRCLVLERSAYLPKSQKDESRMRKILQTNAYLNESLLLT